MFNRSAFNRTRFNIHEEGTRSEILIRKTFFDSLNGLFGLGTDYTIDGITFSSGLFQVSAMGAGVELKGDRHEDLNVMAAPFEYIYFVDTTLLDGIEFYRYASANYYYSAINKDDLMSIQTTRQNIWAFHSLLSKTNVYAATGANIYLYPFFTDILSSLSDANSLEEYVFMLSVAVPPGAELRIDSENYTVTLDGENVLHLQSGDWIDLDRDLWSITVDSGTGGNLSGKIIYTERYL